MIGVALPVGYVVTAPFLWIGSLFSADEDETTEDYDAS